jgi:hypothetical protein
MQDNSTNTKDTEIIKYISIETEDVKSFKVDSRIRYFSKLLNNIIEDYQEDSDISKLNGVLSGDLEVIADFCESIDYNYNLQILPKPLPLDYTSHLTQILQANPKLKIYYSKLDSKTVFNYAKIADFFDVKLLEDILYLKLHDTFSSPENIEFFFREECEENKIKINQMTTITKDRKNFLRDKYMIYCEKYISQLSDEDVEKYLEKELENKIING